jgi:hypothetical protein
VLGHSPSSGYEPFFGAVSSSSSRRLDTLYHDWPDQAVGANVWWKPEDRDLPDKSHLTEILDETGCVIVVTLGLVVAQHVGVKDPMLLETYDVMREDGPLRVLVFPHPSGVNRFWNDYHNRVRAADLLKETLLS